MRKKPTLQQIIKMSAHPKLRILSQNIGKGFRTQQTRQRLFNEYAKANSFDFFCLSEVRCTSQDDQTTWTSTALTHGFHSNFQINNDTAILWRTDSLYIKSSSRDEALESSVSPGSGTFRRISSQTFELPSLQLTLISIYAPSGDPAGRQVFFTSL